MSLRSPPADTSNNQPQLILCVCPICRVHPKQINVGMWLIGAYMPICLTTGYRSFIIIVSTTFPR